MSEWDKLVAKYPTRFPLDKGEEAHLHIPLKEPFAVHLQGGRYIFAKFLNTPVWSANRKPWRYLDDDTTVTEEHLQTWFPNHVYLDTLDTQEGTAEFNRKKVQWNFKEQDWYYLNNWKVHFISPSTSAEQSDHKDLEDDDTAKVEDLL